MTKITIATDLFWRRRVQIVVEPEKYKGIKKQD